MDDLTEVVGVEAEEKALAAALEAPKAMKRLWSPMGVAIMSTVFTPLFGMILYIINYHRIGDYQRRNLAIMGYLAVVMGILAAVFWLPPGFQSLVYGLNIGAAAVFYNTQKDLYKGYKQEGGKSANFVFPLVISVALTALLFYLMIMFASMPERSEQFYNDELFYNDETTAQERQRLISYLETVGFFGDNNNMVSVKLERTPEGLVVGFIVLEAYIDDPEALKAYQGVLEDLRTQVFPGEQIVLQLTDDIFRVRKEIR